MSVPESLTEQVIAQVRSRPVLWDKKHEMYGNVQAMDYEWNKLSILLKRDKEFLKKRWRRVRDVFRIEMKKLNPPENPTKPLLSYYIGVWPHFKDMFFLKDSLMKRTPRLFFPEENDETIDQLLSHTLKTPTSNTNNITNTSNMGNSSNFITIPINTNDSVIENSMQEVAESPETYEEVGDDEVEIDEKPFLVSIQNDWMESDTDKEPRGGKRKAEDWDVALDEDVNFAKSIVGFLKRLNPIRKLIVRNEIQSILLRELLCDKCRCQGQKRACECQ